MARSVEIIACIRHTLDLSEAQLGEFTSATTLVSLKKVKELLPEPALVSSALLGLFPIANLGILRDTRWMMENEDALTDPVRIFLNARSYREDDIRARRSAVTNAAPVEWCTRFCERDARHRCRSVPDGRRPLPREQATQSSSTVGHGQEADHCTHHRRSSRTR